MIVCNDINNCNQWPSLILHSKGVEHKNVKEHKQLNTRNRAQALTLKRMYPCIV